MTTKPVTLAMVGAVAMLALAGCAPTYQQQPASAGTATGAVTGAVVGGVLGNVLSADGRRTENTAIGAALGATLGGGVGYALDHQQQSRDAALAAERARSEAEADQLRREVELLRRQRDLQRRTAVPTAAAGTPDPDPLRVVITPRDDARLASGW